MTIEGRDEDMSDKGKDDTAKGEIVGVLTTREANTFNNLRTRELALAATFEAAWLNHMNIVSANNTDNEELWLEICERLGIDRDELGDTDYSLKVEIRQASASVVKYRKDSQWNR